MGIRDGTPWDLELPLITATGRHIWVRAVGEVEFDAGQPVRLVGALQDVTERKRLQKRLADGQLNRDPAGQQKVKLILEDGSQYAVEGTLQFRDVTVDPATGSVILRVVVPNPQGVLLPGMFVRAVVTEGVHEQAILAPQEAVSRDLKGNPVALVVGPEDKVQMRMLAVDRTIGDKWLVSAGLAPGDRVIVEGMQKVRPGSSVKAVPLDAAKSPDTGPAAPAAAKSN